MPDPPTRPLCQVAGTRSTTKPARTAVGTYTVSKDDKAGIIRAIDPDSSEDEQPVSSTRKHAKGSGHAPKTAPKSKQPRARKSTVTEDDFEVVEIDDSTSSAMDDVAVPDEASNDEASNDDEEVVPASKWPKAKASRPHSKADDTADNEDNGREVGTREQDGDDGEDGQDDDNEVNIHVFAAGG